MKFKLNKLACTLSSLLIITLVFMQLCNGQNSSEILQKRGAADWIINGQGIETIISGAEVILSTGMSAMAINWIYARTAYGKRNTAITYGIATSSSQSGSSYTRPRLDVYMNNNNNPIRFHERGLNIPTDSETQYADKNAHLFKYNILAVTGTALVQEMTVWFGAFQGGGYVLPISLSIFLQANRLTPRTNDAQGNANGFYYGLNDGQASYMDINSARAQACQGNIRDSEASEQLWSYCMCHASYEMCNAGNQHADASCYSFYNIWPVPVPNGNRRLETMHEPIKIPKEITRLNPVFDKIKKFNYTMIEYTNTLTHWLDNGILLERHLVEKSRFLK